MKPTLSGKTTLSCTRRSKHRFNPHSEPSNHRRQYLQRRSFCGLCAGPSLSRSKGGLREQGWAKGRFTSKVFSLDPTRPPLSPGEIVREIQVPPNRCRHPAVLYIKLSPRSRMDLAVVGVAAVVRKDNGAFGDTRIGLGAVAPTPMRAMKAETKAQGETVSEKVILAAAKVAAQESKPINDHRASAEYRRMMVEVLVNRAIQQALSN